MMIMNEELEEKIKVSVCSIIDEILFLRLHRLRTNVDMPKEWDMVIEIDLLDYDHSYNVEISLIDSQIESGLCLHGLDEFTSFLKKEYTNIVVKMILQEEEEDKENKMLVDDFNYKKDSDKYSMN